MTPLTPQELQANGLENSNPAGPGGPSTTEALVRGGIQGATLGFSDEIKGAAGALFEKHIKHNPQALAELYRQLRDEERAKNAAAEQAHPIAYGGASLAGGAGAALATGGASLGGAAAFGAANALGESNADITKGDLGGAAADTATGAAIGGALHGAGTLVGKAGKAILGGGAGEKASEEAVHEAGARALGFNPGHIAALKENGDLGSVVEQAQKDGVFAPGRSLREVDARFKAAGAQKAQAVVDTVNAEDAAGKTFNLSAARRDLEARAEKVSKELGANIGGKEDAYQKTIGLMKQDEAKFGGGAPAGGQPSEAEIAAYISKTGKTKITAADLKKMSSEASGGAEGADVQLPFSAGHKYKQNLQVEGFGSKVDPARGKPVAAAWQDASDVVRKQLAETSPAYAKAVGESEPYMMAHVAEKDAAMKLAGAQGGVAAPAVLPAAGFALAQGRPLVAAGIMAGSVLQKQARQRAQSTAYWAMKKATGDAGTSTTGKIAQLLNTAPKVLGKYGPILRSALATGGEDKLNQTHYVLSQTSREYRDMMESVHAKSQEDLGKLSPADEATSE